jgi:perosamine synthetase
MKVFCYGASGHGKVVADILTASGRQLLGFVDDDPAKAGAQLAGVEIFSPQALDDFRLRHASAIITIGANRSRTEKAEQLRERGFSLATAIHPSATIARDTEVGCGTVIMAGAVVNSGCRLGAHVIVNTGATVDHDCVLGDGVHISPGASLAGGVVVASHAQVGVRASVIQNIQIGAGAIVGAGAVVIRDVPAGATVVGNPARPLHSSDSLSPAKARILVDPEQSIRQTLQAIDDSGLAIALVVDGERRLLGTVTDGDVRRAILRGALLEQPVSTIMNPSPATVTPAEDLEQIREFLVGSALKHAVVADGQNRVTDLITVNDVLSAGVPEPTVADGALRSALAVMRVAAGSGRGVVDAFEQKIAACANRRYAVAVQQGAAALHLLLRALDLQNGDEVITTPFGFAGLCNGLLRENLLPRFADIQRPTYNLDPEKVEAAITGRTRAILAADTFGQPAAYDGLQAIATRHRLRLIGDASQSIGAEYQRRRATTCPEAAVLQFSASAQISAGEGGAVVTDDEALADRCRQLRDCERAQCEGESECRQLVSDIHLPELNAALGLAELERLDEVLAQRQVAAEAYHRALDGLEEVRRAWVSPQTTRMSWFVYPVCLGEQFSRQDRSRILARLQQQGVAAKAYFPAIHLQPLYRERFGFEPGLCPVAESVSDRTLALPLAGITEHDAERAARELSRAVRVMTRRERMFVTSPLAAGVGAGGMVP